MFEKSLRGILFSEETIKAMKQQLISLSKKSVWFGIGTGCYFT
jgi:hypothetical protein